MLPPSLFGLFANSFTFYFTFLHLITLCQCLHRIFLKRNFEVVDLHSVNSGTTPIGVTLRYVTSASRLPRFGLTSCMLCRGSVFCQHIVIFIAYDLAIFLCCKTQSVGLFCASGNLVSTVPQSHYPCSSIWVVLDWELWVLVLNFRTYGVRDYPYVILLSFGL